MKGFRWKIAAGLLGVTLAATGAVSVWSHYKDAEFQPNTYAEDRQRKENQIVFPGQDNTIGDQPSDDSELWKQNESSKDNMKPEDRPSSSVLFQTLQVADSQQADRNEQVQKPDSTENPKDTVYAPGGNDKNGPKTPGNTVKKDDPSSDNNENNGSNGDNSNKSDGDDHSSDNSTDDDSPSEPAKPSDSDKPSDSNKPSDPDTSKDTDKEKDKDTTVPVAPKDDPLVPADPYPGDDEIDIKNDEEYKKYSLSIVGNMDSDDEQNSIYLGEYLNDQRVFYSTKVYLCIDGTPTYRLTELNDNFKLGAYPERVAEDTDEITFTYYYRPSDKYDWIKGTYTMPIVYSAKLLLQDWKSGEYIKQVMVPKDDPKVALITYYYQMMHPVTSSFGFGEIEPATKLFTGWSQTEEGVSVGPFYTVENTGVQILYPVGLNPVEEQYQVGWQYMSYGLYFAQVQTMTDYTGDTGENAVLNVPEGVQCIDLDEGDFWTGQTIRTFNKMKIPGSVLSIERNILDELKGLNVTGEYEVSADNIEYSSYDGMLLNKAQTEIYDIPYNMDEVRVPNTVENINFRYSNCISKIYFTADKPGDFNFDGLMGAEIHVPASSYLKYLAAWGKNPGGIWGNNVLVADGDDIEDFIEDENGIYSSDGKVLKSAKKDISGVYVVPEGIETIADGALDNCGVIDLLILPKSLRTLEDNSLSGNPPTKIVFLGDEATTISEHTFADSSILQVHKSAKSSYEAAWREVIGDQADAVHYRTFTYKENGIGGFDYLDEGACEDGICEEGAVLIKAPNDLTVFDENVISGLQCKEIAGGAFSGCDELMVAILPASIKKIGREAFSECSKLEGVISESNDYIEIGESAFYGDYDLRWLAWNAKQIDNKGHGSYAQQFATRDSNGSDYNMNCYSPSYYAVSEAGGYLLYGIAVDTNGNATNDRYLVGATTSIAGEVTLEKNTMEVTGSVFSNCGNSFTITDWEQLEYIDGSAFSNSGLSGEIRLSNKLKQIDMYAFYGCSDIEKLVINGSEMSGYAMGYSCFRGCSSLTSVEFTGTGSYEIGSNAFTQCGNLTSVTFGEDVGITSIGTEAFTETAITELTIPKSVTSVGNYIVGGCTDFKKMTFTSEQPPMLIRYAEGTQFYFSDEDMDGKIVVPNGQAQTYIDTWKYYVIGYTPEEAGQLTQEQILEGENIVRGYFGMEQVTEQKITQEPEKAIEPATEDTEEIPVQENTTESGTDTSTTEAGATEQSSDESNKEDTTQKEPETVDASDTEQSTQEEDTEEQP